MVAYGLHKLDVYIKAYAITPLVSATLYPGLSARAREALNWAGLMAWGGVSSSGNA